MTIDAFEPSRRSDVAPFIAMDVLSEAAQLEAQGRRIVHMEVGQPSAPAPKAALNAARQALEHGRLGYTEALGIQPLRTALAAHYKKTYGVEVPVERVMVTTGSSAGFNLAFLAAFDPGDRIVLTAPGYPAYRNILKALDLVPVEVEVSEETRWSLTPSHLEDVQKDGPIKGVLVASPANPTGTMMAPEALEEMIRYCDDQGIWFISDEIYHGLDYAGEQKTALETSQNAIIINSFSKYYCMTGWRIGWMVLPEQLVRPTERIAQSLYISPPELSQIAATAALDSVQELEAVKAGYAANRSLLLDGLPRIGLDQLLPVDGAFYIYADISRFSSDSLSFARQVLYEAGVAVTPGVDFDPVHGNEYLRFSFAGAHQDMKEALERLGPFLQR
ncbi:MAG: aminotransferase class I/II-fold pyridoxal phosphate-dependent enzyme [Roseibium sp.]|uniref:pyridoxal phosphate-dependent aminotransferase n=1 Tax=Roseibium sp. TaxID=1936156 RepID=UPI001B1D076A|nr:aminotransferase class I/II-fold pyridoxal phosphate-dependent enzyme [Roseibium sp.]MBO6895593.1 aminotransferase class I/II-fold pyridoxal phosphate-dependent enzyme [Roseibium sp.]MBO6929543.1 aminotransferase class I/II-fold pyridoxal phosphate-dependent enzyme [Roseibium sp.]